LSGLREVGDLFLGYMVQQKWSNLSQTLLKNSAIKIEIVTASHILLNCIFCAPFTNAYGQDDGTANGGGHLLGALDAKANMTVATNGHDSLETSTLTDTSLLLNLDLEPA
jgi:hypothetical protein